MLLRPVENSSDFKKRFRERFNNTRIENPSLNKFIYEISLRSNLFIVGGYLRNVINGESPRDLDIIVNVPQEELAKLVSDFFRTYRQNRIEGFKISLEMFDFDVWSVENNWAFKMKLIKNIDVNIVDKIASGTFFNYDSLVLDLHSFQYNFQHYNDCATNKVLDIIQKRSKYKKLNPTKEANVLRAFYLKIKYGLAFSTQLRSYIVEQLKHSEMTYNSRTKKLVETLNRYPKYLEILSEQIIKSEVENVFSRWHEIKSSSNKSTNQNTLFDE